MAARWGRVGFGRAAAVALGVAALGWAGVPPTSAATPLTCGSVVTASVALTNDLTCPSGDALVAGADDIVIDLKGHTLSGPGPVPGGAGVRVFQHTGVEVRNGSISGFGNGVTLDTARGNRVWNITFTGNWRGIEVANAQSNLVEKNRIGTSGLDAVRLAGYGSTDNVIRQNVVTDNVFGLTVADGAARSLVAQNSVSGSRDWGVAVFSDPVDTTVSQNLVSGTVTDGILVSASAGSGTVVRQNQVSGNGDDGIDVDTATTLRSNLATYNGDLGIEAVPAAIDAGGNVAFGNGNPAQCVGVTCASA